MSKFSLPLDYNDVASRIVEFRAKHAEGSLQQVSLDFKEVAGGWWVIYTAAAYRHPEDARPGIGTAWEPVPGRTPYTKDSEVQNAETAAWGRAIVAALAADTKKGIASAEEVRNRQVEREEEAPHDWATEEDPSRLRARLAEVGKFKGLTPDEIAADFEARTRGLHIRDGKPAELRAHLAWLEKQPDKWESA